MGPGIATHEEIPQRAHRPALISLSGVVILEQSLLPRCEPMQLPWAPHSERSVLGLILCCWYEILSKLGIKFQNFAFALGSANYVACPW